MLGEISQKYGKEGDAQGFPWGSWGIPSVSILRRELWIAGMQEGVDSCWSLGPGNREEDKWKRKLMSFFLASGKKPRYRRITSDFPLTFLSLVFLAAWKRNQSRIQYGTLQEGRDVCYLCNCVHIQGFYLALCSRMALLVFMAGIHPDWLVFWAAC